MKFDQIYFWYCQAIIKNLEFVVKKSYENTEIETLFLANLELHPL